MPMLTKIDLKAISRVMDKKLLPLNKKVDLILDYFDDKYLDHEKRISKIEGHLSLTSTSS
jgi:hypothetical protein